ncbi:MAG: hypothetical protein RJA22_2555 [Verrucomicrobiota bacterium]
MHSPLPLLTLLFCSVPALVLTVSAAEHTPTPWKKIHVTPHFWAEGANIGDFNKDGQMDLVYGPYWWAGPDFQKRHEYYPATKSWAKKSADGTEERIPGFKGALSRENEYSDNFFAYTHDFNRDGWTDILIYGFPGKDASWYENPRGKEGHWTRHKVLDVVDNESPQWLDVDGDGRPEIICNSGGYFGYASPDWSDTTKPWTFHRITAKGPWQRFTHGIGLGDVNGDGRQDFLEMNGWWEQPASLAGDPQWKQHKVAFAPGAGSAHMFAYDVNADGRNDVISSLAAHGYGLAWYEQLAEKDTNGSPKFKQHIIINKEPSENKYGVAFSQLHAIDLVDMNGDGLKDIVTGKRFWAHGPTGDAAPNAPAVLYWFQLVRGPGQSVDWVPHLIDNDSGIGTQVVAADVNGDGKPDVVVGNKKGAFVHLQGAGK